jgi:release factor glutamine methyltransferase
MTPGDDAVVDAIVARLRAAGCVFAEDEAAVLLESASGDGDLQAMLARREAGEPLEVIVGWAMFRGRRVIVAPGTFVPRRRTELLVSSAVGLAAPGALVVELCCGVAAVASAIAAEVPDAEVYAADLDPAEVEVARRNLPPVSGADRVFEGDLFDALPPALRGRVGILVVNAPYVPTAEIALMPAEAREHEPRVALDGGPDGLDVQRRIADGAREWLAPGGSLIIETSVRQAAGTADAMRAGGLEPRTVRDDDLDGTVVIGTVDSEAAR